MSQPPSTNTSSFVDALSRADEYLSRLQQLPPASEFKEAVEQEFWMSVTGKSDPPKEVAYTDLPDSAHNLIGTYEGVDGPIEPWWLQEFTWKARFGSEVELQGEGLESFAENFDRDATTIKRPTLQQNLQTGHVYDAIKALHEIRSELEDRITRASGVRFPDFPESLFVVKEGSVEPTDVFSEWIESLLSLAPAIGPEATALYLAHTGTSKAAAESALDDDLFEEVNRVLEFEYSSYEPRMVNEFDKVLDLNRVFNRNIPLREGFDKLSGLQYQLFKGFLETFEPNDAFTQEIFDTATRRRPSRLGDDQQGLFTRLACGTPILRYADDRPKLMSARMYSPKTSGKAGYSGDSYRDVRTMFEEYGWFDDA